MKFRLFLILTVLFSVTIFQVAVAAPTINVRAGIHERYNRLVFDWTEKVTYKLDQQNGRVSIQFNKDGIANFRAATGANAPFIRNLQQQPSSAGMLVTFQIPDDSRVQGLLSGTKIVFDILLLKPGKPSFANAEKPAETKPAEAASPPVEEKVTEKPAEVPVPAVTSAPAEPAKQQDTRLPMTLADRLAQNKPSDSSLQPPPNAKPDAAPAETEPTAGTVIRLKPEQLTRLAVFERAGNLWLVLDQPLKTLVPNVQGSMKDKFQNARRINLENATAFVFDMALTSKEFVMSIRRDGPEWQVWFNPADKPYLPSEIPVSIKDKENEQEAQLVLYAGEKPKVITIKDTTMGDRIWIVPVRSPEGRIIEPRNTPTYRMLATYMGAAIIPQDDSLRVGTLNDLVVLSPAAGRTILMSDEKDREKGLAEAVLTPIFNLDIALDKAYNKSFSDKRQLLETRLLAQKDTAKKVPALMDMAKLYIANGFGAEASGLLRIAKSMQPAIEADQSYRALRGIASAMAGDLVQAGEDLDGSDDLRSQPAAKLWYGYALAQANRWQEARVAFADSTNSELSFPKPLRARLILAKAETSLQAEDMASAEQELKKIKDTSGLTAAEKAAYDYIKASTLVVTNKRDEAFDLYQELAKGNDQLYRSKSEFELIKQKLAKKEIPLETAIEKLERLRFSWRGDRLEVEILDALAQAYVDHQNYLEGLTLWRQAASLSKNSDDTDMITQKMQATFKSLYVDGIADKLEPLQALAIYERFRELTPAGEEGNIALRRLADRLITVDLLDQADALLQNQLLKSAQGEDAVKIGTKLATIRLLNRNASGALKALDESDQTSSMDEELAERRNLLRARAFADEGQIDEALTLLQQDRLPEEMSLKADILWRQARWSEAVVALQKLVMYYRNDGQLQPDGPMPKLVLKMAIALALDDNRKGLDLLIAEYGEFMASTDRADAFTLITKPSRGSSLADLETLKGQVGEVELFEQFLKKFDS